MPAPAQSGRILGISAYYHDSAACLVVNGEIVAAAQEERFTRKKHDDSFPRQSIDFCLRRGGISADQVDLVVFYEKPFLKFDRILHTYLARAPAGLPSFLKSVPLWLKKKIWLKDELAKAIPFPGKILFPEHHQSHAASAFYPSPFDSAAILTVDGVGEWTTTSIGLGNERRIELMRELRFPHSLGLLYSAFTYYCGFRVNSGEYKLMGLAPYGTARFKDLILSELLDLKEDGSFRLNMRYFNYETGSTMITPEFETLFEGSPREPESPITQRHMDLARSIQEVTDEIMLRLARTARSITGAKNLCMAGGVALNCVANGWIVREKIFENIWVQPAAGDAGGALGAALIGWHDYLEQPREIRSRRMDSQRGSLLGPEFTDEEIRAFLNRENIPATRLEPKELMARVAQFIAEENVVGWFQGRMEFGPRALGNRSILGDARSARMQQVMNLKIKFRESFRPFAPAVLEECASEWFELDQASPYMLIVAPVAQPKRLRASADDQNRHGFDRLDIARSEIPAVTHVDDSARVQTVDAGRNPRFSELLKAFAEKEGCPVLINTSFNVRGEPIVCSPEDAYRCFMRSNIDYLVLGNFLLDKREQPVQNSVPLTDLEMD